MKLYIPENFDFDIFEKLNKPHTVIKGYKRDKIAFILHQLNYITMLDSRYQHTGELIPLSSTLCRKRLGNNYTQYFNILGLAGIIETDNWYIAKEKCKGYRISYPFNKGLKEFEVTDYSFKRNLTAFYREQLRKPLRKYTYLKKWFNENLEIHSEACYRFIREDCRIRQHYPYLRNKDGDEYKAPEIQYACARMCIDHFVEKNFRGFTIDGSGYRFHSLLTSMRKTLRHGLSYEGKQLCELDISNSQPFFSIQLFKAEFWVSAGKEKRFKSLITQIYKSNTINNPTIMFTKIQQIQSQHDVQHYIRLVEKGELYEFFIDQYKKEFNSCLDRNEIKTELFSVLFSKNSTSNKSKELFKKLFPTVDHLFRMIKNGKNNTLALLLQRIESDIILGDICKTISLSYPDVPLFTIHDSIATISDHAELLKTIMTERFNNRIGIVPKIKMEFWSLENMQMELDTLKAKIRPPEQSDLNPAA